MLRTRIQGEDSMFRWARTEMKREMVMSQSSYAKIAGIQSEVGRVVVTRVAGSELEYKRVLNMYRKDMTCSVNNIRREQVKMKLRMGRYAKKLRQTKVENAKRLREEQRRDRERAALEELHLRLKQEAARRPSEVNKTENEALRNGDERRHSQSSLSDVNVTEGPVYLQTGVIDDEEDVVDDHSSGDNTSTKKPKRISRIETRPFSPILPMINEDAEKECDGMEEVDEKRESEDVTEGPQTELVVPEIVTDETMSVSSGDFKKKKKKDVSFSDIIKLKYTGTKHLFDLVHTLAKRHGIPDVVEKVPDPRDNVVLRGSTNDSLRLQAAVLYPMMRGYNPESEDDGKEVNELMLKSPTVSNNNVTDYDSDVNYESDVSEDNKPKRHRKLSMEQRRAIYLSGKHSKSLSDTEDLFLPELGDSPEKYTKIHHRDRSLPELVERVSRIKHDIFDRSSDRLDTGSGSLSPLKPLSSRSSRSLPAALKNSGKPGDKVSWTQAFGLLRAIHSLEDIS